MKRETIIWSSLLSIGVVLVLIRAFVLGGVGLAYTHQVDKTLVEVIPAPAPDADPSAEETPESPRWVEEGSEAATTGTRTATDSVVWTEWEHADPRFYHDADRADANQTAYSLSTWRTIGLWFAAFLTLSIFSFLYRDNPLYKLAESIFIGVSAAYWMVVAFWSVLIPNLFAKLLPAMVQNWAMPGLSGDDLHSNVWYIVPLALSIMLLWRLSPKGGWIARWPLAFFIGVFAGLRMIQFIQADFLNQIRNGIVPLLVMDDAEKFQWGESIRNMIMVFGVLACLTYFFFSIEHKGVIGKISRLGIWILMITFGAMFAFTVMGRITLLSARFEFLFDDWLWLIDPTGKREVIEAATSMIMMIT